jgi:hypothetical protein
MDIMELLKIPNNKHQIPNGFGSLFVAYCPLPAVCYLEIEICYFPISRLHFHSMLVFSGHHFSLTT